MFRIAAEFGQKLKSPRQCRVLFNNCPFNYTQVLGVVADLRKVILGQPLNEPQTDTVVNLVNTIKIFCIFFTLFVSYVILETSSSSCPF